MITLPNLDTIIDSLPFSIAYLDNEYRFIYMNRAFLNLINSSAETVLGKPCYETVGEYVNNPERKGKDKICSFCKLDEVFRNKKPVTIERPLGDKFIRVTTIPEMDDAGNIYRFIEVIEDITDRKGTEETLKLEAQLLDAATDSIFLHDFNGRFIYLNEAAYKSHGYTKDELMALNLHDFDVPEYAKIIEPRIRELMEKGEATFESAHLCKDGTVMPIEVHARIIEVGDKKLVLSVTRDITGRKQKEETIEKLRLERELILNSAGEGILGLDIHGNHTFVNPSAAQMFGYTVNELIGKHSHTIWHHTKTDGSPYPNEECPIYAVLKSGSNNHRRDEVFWRKDGTSFPVSYTATPIKDESNIVGAVVTFLDITESKFIEEELKRLATTDTLTGALNRIKIGGIIEREIERVKRYNQPLSVILFDIDHFKDVNDRYGHNAGDYVLKTIADIVRENIRSIDYFVRWGGEEFIILSSETQLDEASTIHHQNK